MTSSGHKFSSSQFRLSFDQFRSISPGYPQIVPQIMIIIPSSVCKTSCLHQFSQFVRPVAHQFSQFVRPVAHCKTSCLHQFSQFVRPVAHQFSQFVRPVAHCKTSCLHQFSQLKLGQIKVQGNTLGMGQELFFFLSFSRISNFSNCLSLSLLYIISCYFLNHSYQLPISTPFSIVVRPTL